MVVLSAANHYSKSVNEDEIQFLMNSNQIHFSQIKASDLRCLNYNVWTTLDCPNTDDPSARVIHG